MEKKRVKVFISYSWDNVELKSWVLQLAKDLMEIYGVEIILDQYELKAGKDLTYFMENSIEKSDKVLIILTPIYKEKAEARISGVGYETSMISQEIFESPITNIKFIPVLRNGDFKVSTPKFLGSKVKIDLRDDKKYLTKLSEIAKSIYDVDLIEKPTLGPIPDFTNEEIDPIISIANKLKAEEDLNREIDHILHSYEGTQFAQDNVIILTELLNDKSKLYRKSSNLFFAFETNQRDLFLIRNAENTVTFYAQNLYSGIASNITLQIKYWEGIKSIDPSAFVFEQPKLIDTLSYKFDLNYQKEVVWKFKSENFTVEQIASNIFTFFIEELQKIKSKNFRGK